MRCAGVANDPMTNISPWHIERLNDALVNLRDAESAGLGPDGPLISLGIGFIRFAGSTRISPEFLIDVATAGFGLRGITFSIP